MAGPQPAVPLIPSSFAGFGSTAAFTPYQGFSCNLPPRTERVSTLLRTSGTIPRSAVTSGMNGGTRSWPTARDPRESDSVTSYNPILTVPD
jgi:hypothetical protein